MLGEEHVSFTSSKIGSLVDVNDCKDAEGLRCFYYLVQVNKFVNETSSNYSLEYSIRKLHST